MTLHGDELTSTYTDLVSGRPSTRRAEAVGDPEREPNGRGAAEGGGDDRTPLVVIGNNPAKCGK